MNKPHDMTAEIEQGSRAENGLDDIGLTLEKKPAIDAFEAKAAQERPWV